MSRILPFFLSVSFLLAGCTAAKEVPPPSASSLVESSTSEELPAVNMVELANSLRAELEAQGLTIQEIQPYEGDLLVCAGDLPNSGHFFWYFSDTDTLAPLVFLNQDILDYEILNIGSIRILVGESNRFNGWKDFPAYYYADAAFVLDQDGRIPDSIYSSGTGNWGPITPPSKNLTLSAA